ncbi:MAG: cache domain-containing protein, partial [Treponema sp.]|nr:cache domain-containing protein [Treponema sp.]
AWSNARSNARGTDAKNDSKMLRRITAIIVGSMTFGMLSVATLSIIVFGVCYMRNTQNLIVHTADGAMGIMNDWALTLKGLTSAAAVRPDLVKAIREGDREPLEEIIASFAGSTDVELFAFTDRNGIVLPGGGYNIEAGTILRDHAGVADALAGREGLTYEPLGDMGYAVTYSFPVRDSGGSLLGVVVSAYDLTTGSFVELMKDGFDVECTVFQGGERMETTLAVGAGSRLDNAAILHEVLDGQNVFVGRNRVDGVSYLCVYEPLKSDRGDVTGMLFIAKDLSEVYSISNRVIVFVIPYTLLMVVISGLVVFFAMNRMRRRERTVSESLFSETEKLVVAARANAATAQDQTASVKEIVATMEDNNALAENIAVKIQDVSGVAEKTRGTVAEGVSYLEANVRQLHEIASANQNTIDGIKSLGDKINNIWDIVTLINSVADQAKIIAFNAELEASSAGEAGKNFHIVATEIRRLADGIIDGTKEIKGKISEIQQSSDQLIIASESGTDRINEGVDGAKNLKERFGSIKNASEVTASSAGDITRIIQQQATATEQILTTLRQIAGGVESFSSATESISRASEKLRAIAEDLNG